VVTAWEPLFFFCPFPVSRGTQIHECCIKFRNDLIMHRTLSSLKKESESGSRHEGAITRHQLVGHQWATIPVAPECQGTVGRAPPYRGAWSL
jgi:hypothetical protein